MLEKIEMKAVLKNIPLKCMSPNSRDICPNRYCEFGLSKQGIYNGNTNHWMGTGRILVKEWRKSDNSRKAHLTWKSRSYIIA